MYTMPMVSKYTVVPRVPERLKPLLEIAGNLWWCWNHDAIDMFHRIDRDLWTRVNQNASAMLGQISQLRLDELAKDDSFLAHMDRVQEKLRDYMETNTWADRNPDASPDFCVAYMSAEFGLHESLRIYSGGLGVLAGDHLKAASDLGLPLVGIGMLYREGYFSQYLSADGWQQETYPHNDFYNIPIAHERDKSGAPLTIEIPYPEGMIKAYVWRCQVGRVPLFLLDCDHEDNSPAARAITAQLYGGDRETRVRQEILLGMGGVIAMHALGIQPTTYHMNEGHAAFMTLQRIKDLVLNDGMVFEDAIETVKAGSFFTTHTPVPAGNDMFEPALVERYFHTYCAEVGIPFDRLLRLGRQNPDDSHEPFCMTVLALRLSSGANGVSKLHGEVARNMWNLTWTGVPEEEVPITSITNGIHTRSVISRDLSDLYDRYLGPGWVNSPDDHSIWQRIDSVPDTELWRTHERRRERLVNFARRRLAAQYEKRGATDTELRICHEVLNPDTLTIGFARRFATYKRAALILRDRERLMRILTNPEHPVQFIIAGKAHPADTAGKQLIRDLQQFAREPAVRRNFIFLEDYDINVARYMVQGVDCWLNTPRRPMEASGTSGMKASANGGLNISIPDGWWCEAEHLGPNGWSIGRGEQYDDLEEQDRVESELLYEILEKEVVPTFYDRGSDDLPRQWIHRMKSAIRTIGPVFNTYRMVQEYTDRCYIPSSNRRNALKADGRKRALALSAWKQRVHKLWPKVRIASVESGPTENLPVGTHLSVSAVVHLGELTSKDVTVEVYYGTLDTEGQIEHGHWSEMKVAAEPEKGDVRFEGSILCNQTGQLGFTVRAIPSHEDLAQKHETTLIAWA
ncbi:MAG: alpha-glucan family phosphorylase [Candidatus Hydrogenedentes bacterium]|nr:alpha-glucan family phosphorylase [Candidatus Hydrogenedentota bacterium]